MKWNELSMKEKLPFMQKAIVQGIVKPSEIEEHFNSFQNGGRTGNASQPSLVERGLQKLGILKPETYVDAYGIERTVAPPLSESAQGQELQRMGKTALTGAALTAGAFTGAYIPQAYGAYKAAAVAAPVAATAIESGLTAASAADALYNSGPAFKESMKNKDVADALLHGSILALESVPIFKGAIKATNVLEKPLIQSIEEGRKIAKTVSDHPKVAISRPGYLFSDENREAVRLADVFREKRGSKINEMLPRNMKDLRRIARQQNMSAEEARQFTIDKSLDKIERGFTQSPTEGYIHPVTQADQNTNHPFFKHLDFDALYLQRHKKPLSDIDVRFMSEKNYNRTFPEHIDSDAIYGIQHLNDNSVREHAVIRRNAGKLMYPSEHIGYNTTHELGHGIQSRIPALNNSAMPGMGYYIPNTQTEIGRLAYQASSSYSSYPPTMNDLWRGSPLEMHSELWANRYRYRNLPVRERNKAIYQNMYDRFNIKDGDPKYFEELIKTLKNY